MPDELDEPEEEEEPDELLPLDELPDIQHATQPGPPNRSGAQALESANRFKNTCVPAGM